MALENRATVQQHVRLPADDPTTEAVATYLVRERQRSLRDALLTATSLVEVARGFSAWIADASTVRGTDPPPSDLYADLELPAGFAYFDRSSDVPVIDAAPAWHHLDEPQGAEPPESPHAAIVREVVEDHTNTINVQLFVAVVVAAIAVVLRVAADRYHELEWLTSWCSWTLGLAATLTIALALLRYYARKIGRSARDRIDGHDALEAARALRRQFEDSNAWTTEPG